LLQAYISNVLVKESERGKGYGKQIMVAAEQQAVRMGYPTVTLHVDANPTSGKVAQAMYTRLGYQPIVQMCSQKNPNLSQEDTAVEGSFTSAIHLVDGIPLFYMYKTIP
jgi:predicted GNAT family acetyltransferase